MRGDRKIMKSERFACITMLCSFQKTQSERVKSERFACITMLCSFQKTQKEMTGRENSNIK